MRTAESGYSLSDQAEEVAPLPAIDEQTLAALKALEREAVRLAEGGSVPAAMQKLDEAIARCPIYASAYNNRAQARRMTGDVDGALNDLDKAIEYGAGNAAILKQAFTQRSIIRKSRGDAAGAESDLAQGARYGNEIAKATIKQNPYAKLCSAMVAEAMKNC
ncbi:hypothetical protein BDK51DRAFT_26086 [Blyttiomyces helicus]|uniref:Uncharacterized protein n=1 Tax=Blyttiomyces helicus TaxID=388810 RepID=A0A4P9WL52_9FUNG|nr:hypothetical protein BDK51DRAFT_26086 [Blyttiomyces helicus]|eukprot:RKO92318.1 hypothetical protein BDK51DRAFT_26086 [Blyttiomyces helicus]